MTFRITVGRSTTALRRLMGARPHNVYLNFFYRLWGKKEWAGHDIFKTHVYLRFFFNISIPSHSVKCIAWWLVNMVFKHYRIKYEGKVSLTNSVDSFGGIIKDCTT